MKQIAQASDAAALYVRLSKEDKDGKHAGCDSIEVQTYDGRAAIEAQRWPLDPRHLFVDDDVSGRKLSRPGWDELLAAARRREFSVLVVRDLDRIARYEPARAMRTLSELADMGVRVWTYRDRAFVTLSGMESVLTYVKACSAQAYVESIRTNVTAALRRRAERGQATNLAPLGYVIRDEGERGKRWAIDAEGAARCHLIAAAFIETRSLFRAAKRLNDKGVLTPKGCTWRATSVRQVLIRPIYRGVYERGIRGDRGPEEVQIIQHPELRIWTPEEEAAIDALLARPAQPWSGTPARHLSTRFVRCGVCGGRLVASGAKRSRGKDVSCDLRRTRGCVGIGSKKEALIDTAILSAVGALLVDEVWSETRAILASALEAQRATDDRGAELDRLRRDVQAAGKRVGNLTEAMAEAESSEERAALRPKLATEAKRLETIRATLKRAEDAPAPESPADILDQAERRVLAFREALAKGGAGAAEVIEAILGDTKFSATREGETWALTAQGSLAGVFVDSSNSR